MHLFLNELNTYGTSRNWFIFQFVKCIWKEIFFLRFSVVLLAIMCSHTNYLKHIDCSVGFFRFLPPLCMSSSMPLRTEHESWAQRKKDRKFPDAAEYGNAYETKRMTANDGKSHKAMRKKNPTMKIAGFFYAKRGKNISIPMTKSSTLIALEKKYS